MRAFRDLDGARSFTSEGAEVMRLHILHMPDCPGAEALASHLGPLLAIRPDIQVTRQVVTTEDEAGRLGMTGSPTILADGRDLFPSPGQQPSLSCRLYPGEHGQLSPAPTASQLREALTPAVPDSPGHLTTARRLVRSPGGRERGRYCERSLQPGDEALALGAGARRRSGRRSGRCSGGWRDGSAPLAIRRSAVRRWPPWQACQKASAMSSGEGSRRGGEQFLDLRHEA